MVTSGEEAGFTVIVTGDAVAVGTEGHDADDVITTVITSPLFNAEDEYEALFVPTFEPFNFH